MIEEALKQFLNYYIVLTIVLAFLFRKSYFHTPQRIFFFVLLALGIVDFLGAYLGAANKKNLLFINYNLGVMLHILGFIYYYYLIVNDTDIRKKIAWISLIYIGLCLLSFLFYSGISSGFNTINYMTGSVFMTIVIIMFFQKILNTEFVLSLRKFLWFWVSIGLIIFYVPVIPVMVSETLNLEGFRGSINIIKLCLSITMYSVFLAGLMSTKKEDNSIEL